MTFGKGRRKPLPQVGRRAKREETERVEMRKVVLAECGGRCVARTVVPEVRCWSAGYLEVHELVDRAVRPGVHLDSSFGVSLCGAHHDWVSSDASRAREVALSFYSWEWEAALARAAELKVLVWRL